MKKLLVSNILAPLSRRIGTAAASFAAGVIVVEPALLERVELIVGAVVLLAFDLAASYYNRKTQEVD